MFSLTTITPPRADQRLTLRSAESPPHRPSRTTSSPLPSSRVDQHFSCNWTQNRALCDDILKKEGKKSKENAQTESQHRKGKKGTKGAGEEIKEREMEAKRARQSERSCLRRNQWQDVDTTFHSSCNNHTLVAYRLYNTHTHIHSLSLSLSHTVQCIPAAFTRER